MDLEKPQLPPLDANWAELVDSEPKYHDYEFPKVTIVIPTYNCMHSVTSTLDSLLAQHYPDFEVLIVDAGSTDRTLEVVKSYRDHRIKIFSVSGFQLYEMMNRGISQAAGKYINFLFPGDFYISRSTLHIMMTLALDHQLPHLNYCGTLLRDGKSEVKVFFHPLTLSRLRLGHQPTSLQSCWFRADVFDILGKFDSRYQLRGGYELLCRFSLHRDLRDASIYRVLTDYDLRWVTRKAVFTHFRETMQIVYKYFGFPATLSWLWHQKDIKRLMKLWLKKLRVAFWGN